VAGKMAGKKNELKKKLIKKPLYQQGDSSR
jgi:hypothetical protein